MRWLFRSVVSLVFLAVVLAAVLFFLPTERIANLAAQQFEASTGRSMTIAGPVKPSLWPVLGVKTGAVEIGSADWAEGGPLLRAEAMEIGVEPMALIGGELRIRSAVAKAPRIVLERAADGRVSWDFGSAGGASTGGGGMRAASLGRAMIDDGSVLFIDHATGERHELSAINATLEAPDFNGAADLELSARLRGRDLSVTGQIGETAPFLAGKVVPVRLTLKSGDSKTGFDGRFGTGPLAAEGQIEASLGNLDAVFGLMGAAAPDLPPPLNGAMSLAGQMTLTPEGTVHLRGGVVQLPGNTLSVAADLVPGKERPRLTATISAGALKLPIAGQAGSDAGTGAWSEAAIDVSGLSALDADLVLSADRVQLGNMALGKVRAGVKLDAARAVFDLREVQAYEGNLTGEFVLNGRKGLSVGGKLRFDEISMKPLLTDLADYQRLVGRAGIELDFLGVGNSEAAIMRSLSGKGAVRLGKGQIEGLDLAGMLRTLDTSYVGEGAKTIFDAITGTFTIKDGVLSNSDLSFVSSLLKAEGKGQVNLGARTLDYRVVPTALTAADGTGGVKVPLKITGSWAKPKFALDLQALADEKLEAEKKKLEEKAKAELAKKVTSELGVQVQEGETLEDAARRKLEEEAAKALGRLLGGN